MIWKWFRRFYFDLKYWKLARVRKIAYLWRNKNARSILRWLQDSQELICYASRDKKEIYWKGLGGIGPVPENLAN